MTTTRTHRTTDPEKDTVTTTTDARLDLDALREQAEQGRRAQEALDGAERERQEQRTAALAAEQLDYDSDLATRGPDLDAELADQRHEALAAFQTAVDDGDLGAALLAWRREASARFAQRELREAWRLAHERSGVGQAPPLPSLRVFEHDETAAFLPALAAAAESGARLDADSLALGLVGERPNALAHEVLPGDASSLLHAQDCPDPSRTEVTGAPVGRRSQGRVARCLSCGASKVLHLPPPEREDEQAQAPGPELMRRPEPDSPYGFT